MFATRCIFGVDHGRIHVFLQYCIEQVFSRVPSALLNLSLSEKIMKNALSRERFCVYRSRKSRKARENEKVHVSVPKSRGVPKVVCLRGCVPKEQQCEKIHNFHHFCAPAKVLPWCERFSLLFAIFRDAPVGQYGNPWSEVPQGNIK